MSDEFLEQSIRKLGIDFRTAVLLLADKGYGEDWFHKATIGDVLDEYDKLSQ